MLESLIVSLIVLVTCTVLQSSDAIQLLPTKAVKLPQWFLPTYPFSHYNLIA